VNIPEHVARQRRVLLALFAVSATLAGTGAIAAIWLLGTGLR
jgi:hypothetical protein